MIFVDSSYVTMQIAVNFFVLYFMQNTIKSVRRGDTGDVVDSDQELMNGRLIMMFVNIDVDGDDSGSNDDGNNEEYGGMMMILMRIMRMITIMVMIALNSPVKIMCFL